MPKHKKHNPKLEKSKGKKGKKESQTEYDDYDDVHRYTPYYMAIVFISIIILVLILLFAVFSNIGVRIGRYDLVKIDYDIYSYEEWQDHDEPTIRKTNTWVNVCSRYDDDCEEGLIEGFYRNLLNKKKGDVVNNKFIPKCKDDDEDGEDDTDPGEDALSFGYPKSHDLYYTDIILWFKILEINKTSGASTMVEAEANSGFNIEDENNIILNIYRYGLIMIRKESLILPL